MEEEQCREAVLSEDYRDFMLTDRFLPYLREGTYLTQPAGVGRSLSGKHDSLLFHSQMLYPP